MNAVDATVALHRTHLQGGNSENMLNPISDKRFLHFFNFCWRVFTQIICLNQWKRRERVLPWAQSRDDEDGEDEEQKSRHRQPWNTNTRQRDTKHNEHNENNTEEVKYHCSCTSINHRLESLTCVLRWRLAAAAAGVEGRGGRDFREAAQWLGELLLWLTDLRTNLLLDEQLPGWGHFVRRGRGHFVRRGRDLSVVWKRQINKVRTGRG